MSQSFEKAALSTAAEMGMESQLEAAESIDVDIDARASKLVQGQLDSVSIDGVGTCMKDGLRVEALHLETDAIAIDPIKAVFGKIELTRSTHASAEVTLTESDINDALASEYLKQKMQDVPFMVGGIDKTLRVQDAAIQLLGEGKIYAAMLIQLSDESDSRQVVFTTALEVRSDCEGVELTNIEYKNGKSLPPDTTQILAEHAARLLNFSNFALDGMALNVETLVAGEDAIRMVGTAKIDSFPS